MTVGSPLFADEPKGEQTAQTFEAEVVKKVKLGYLLYLPPDYAADGGKQWPFVLFLHGAGERGNDIELVKKHGPPKLAGTKQDFPFILVSPQCPLETWWDTDALKALVSDVIAKHRVDHDRVYCTGLSMGGFGTWSLAIKNPDLFAAIAPVCGGGEPLNAKNIQKVPAWVFHGAKDDVVPLERSTEMVEALKKAGGNVEFTIYPEAGHDSWTETYDNPKLYEWLLSHKRGSPASP